MTNAALPARQPAGTLRDLVFISYSHSDKVWLDRLLIFLKPYTRQNLKIWADPYIKVGDKWRRNISEALSQTLCRGASSQPGVYRFRVHFPGRITTAAHGRRWQSHHPGGKSR